MRFNALKNPKLLPLALCAVGLLALAFSGDASALVLASAAAAGATGDAGGDTNLMGGEAGEGDDKGDAGAGTDDATAAAAKTGDKPAEGEKKADDKPASAPDKYEFTAPEGFVIDEVLLGEFTPVLKELGLNQEQAQKLVDFGPKLIAPAVDAAVSKTLESIGFAGAKDWAAASKVDKEFGGDKLPENLGIAKRARDQFATPELRKLLETSPLGNNPEIVRLFYRVGKAISEDGYVPGGKTKTTATPFYDNTPGMKA